MKNVIVTIILSLAMMITLSAQDKLSERISEIKGNVDEIIIKANGEEFTFTGEDAEKLFRSMKRESKMHKMKFISGDDFEWSDDSSKKIIVFEDKDTNNKMKWIGEHGNVVVMINKDGNEEVENFIVNREDGVKKKVEVTIEDGKKMVTVTTTKDGKETIDIYENEEAEKYLDEMKSDKEIDIKIEKEGEGKKIKKIIIETEKETD